MATYLEAAVELFDHVEPLVCLARKVGRVCLQALDLLLKLTLGRKDLWKKTGMSAGLGRRKACRGCEADFFAKWGSSGLCPRPRCTKQAGLEDLVSRKSERGLLPRLPALTTRHPSHSRPGTHDAICTFRGRICRAKHDACKGGIPRLKGRWGGIIQSLSRRAMPSYFLRRSPAAFPTYPAALRGQLLRHSAPCHPEHEMVCHVPCHHSERHLSRSRPGGCGSSWKGWFSGSAAALTLI